MQALLPISATRSSPATRTPSAVWMTISNWSPGNLRCSRRSVSSGERGQFGAAYGVGVAWGNVLAHQNRQGADTEDQAAEHRPPAGDISVGAQLRGSGSGPAEHAGGGGVSGRSQGGRLHRLPVHAGITFTAGLPAHLVLLAHPQWCRRRPGRHGWASRCGAGPRRGRGGGVRRRR